jgi:hypothetical protein
MNGDVGRVSGESQARASSASTTPQAQRVDAVASPFFLSPKVQIATFDSGTGFQIPGIKSKEAKLKNLGQNLWDLLNEHLGLEGRITTFDLVSGRIVFYPVGQLDSKTLEPIPGATLKTIFIPELLKTHLLPDQAKSIQQSADSFLKEIDELAKIQTPRVAFQIGPNRFGTTTQKMFDQLSGNCKALDPYLTLDEKKKPEEQVDQVIDLLTLLNPPINITGETIKNAKRNYALEYSWQPEAPNVGKILAFLDVDLDQLSLNLQEASVKEVSFFSLSKDKQKQQKSGAIQRFIAECKGYRNDQNSLSAFYEFFKSGQFPYIPPTGIFSRMGGNEEFSTDKEMDCHAKLYGANLSTPIASWMKACISQGLRKKILQNCSEPCLQKARELMDGITTEVEGYKRDLLTKTEEDCGRALKVLLDKEVNGTKIHDLSGMEIAKEVIGDRRSYSYHRGHNYLDFVRYFLSLSVLESRKVLSDLTQKDIYKYLKAFFNSSDARLKEVRAEQTTKNSNNAVFPFKGKRFDLELKKIALDIFKRTHSPNIDDIPDELLARWFEEYQQEGVQEDFTNFIQPKKERFVKVKAFTDKLKDVEQEEKDFIATKLEKEYRERFPEFNEGQVNHIKKEYTLRKQRVDQILCEKERSLNETLPKASNESERSEIGELLSRINDNRDKKVMEYAQMSFDLNKEEIKAFVDDCLGSKST